MLEATRRRASNALNSRYIYGRVVGWQIADMDLQLTQHSE